MRMRIATVYIDCYFHFACERAKSAALPHGPTLYTSKSRDLNVIEHVHNIKKVNTSIYQKLFIRDRNNDTMLHKTFQKFTQSKT